MTATKPKVVRKDPRFRSSNYRAKHTQDAAQKRYRKEHGDDLDLAPIKKLEMMMHGRLLEESLSMRQLKVNSLQKA